jgi:hypothetical protein
MNRLRQARWWLVLAVAGPLATFPLSAKTDADAPAPQKLFPPPGNLSLPPLPTVKSPVDFFRELLAMSPIERKNCLTNRPPEIRERILDKVREYQALDPNERELRLRATELRWYLLPLLHRSPTNRAAQLAAVPEDIRDLVKKRLGQWDILLPPLQQEFLDNQRVLRYFSHVDSTNGPPLPEGDQHYGTHDADLARWNALPGNERKRITDRFNQFFELTSREKERTLNTLSNAERQQMEKTLQAFEKLPPPLRAKCIRAFTEFAGMNPAEKQEFLKNAVRWSQMSPAERQAWRDLIAHVPKWPPLPPRLPPPLPPPHVRPTVATNR